MFERFPYYENPIQRLELTFTQEVEYLAHFIHETLNENVEVEET